MRLGAFAGGLAAGAGAGIKLGMEMDDAEARKKRDEIANQLGLEQVAALKDQRTDREREQKYKAEREQFIRDNTMEPVMTDDGAGNAMPGGYRPRALNDADMLRIHEGVGAIDYRYGKLDPEKALAMSRMIKTARDEGAFDAYNEYLRTGDPASAERVFNQKGGVKIAPGSMTTAQKTDDLTGQKYNVLTAKTADGRDLTFDPVAVGRAQGGASAYAANLERGAKFGLEKRKVAAEEKKADAAMESAKGTSGYRAAMADYYRGAKTALANAQANKAANGGQLTDKDKRKLSFEIDTAVGKTLAPELKDDGTGRTVRTDHPLREYRAQISERANAIMAENDYDVSPAAAINRAITETQERVANLNDRVTEAFDTASKGNGWFGGRDDMLGKLREGIDRMKEAGATVNEIKRAAKAAGRDPKLIDEALSFKKAAPVKAPSPSAATRDSGYAGRPSGAQAPAGGKRDYSSLWGS